MVERLARPRLSPVSRKAPFRRRCHVSLVTGEEGTYAARPAVAVVGYDGVSNAIEKRSRWYGQSKARESAKW